MLASLAEYAPPGLRWSRPAGGYHIWCGLPEGVSADQLLARSVEKKVAFVPGRAFYPGGNDGRCCMRLNFSYSRPEIIEEGIKRLGRAMARQMAQL